MIKPSAFGDVVQALPILPVLRERFPQANISWIINRGLEDLLTGHPDLDQIISFDRRAPWWTWPRFLLNLRRQRFDFVLDLQGLLRTGVMSRATGAKFRAGLESAREGSHLTAHLQLSGTDRLVPAHARYWRVAEALNLGDRPRTTQIVIPAADADWARETLSSLNGPLLVVHPGARWETKRWPVERFAAVASKAFRAFGMSIAIVGSRDEQPLGAQFCNLLRRFAPQAQVSDLTGGTSIKQLAAVLESSACVLTNRLRPNASGGGTQPAGRRCVYVHGSDPIWAARQRTRFGADDPRLWW